MNPFEVLLDEDDENCNKRMFALTHHLNISTPKKPCWQTEGYVMFGIRAVKVQLTGTPSDILEILQNFSLSSPTRAMIKEEASARYIVEGGESDQS